MLHKNLEITVGINAHSGGMIEAFSFTNGWQFDRNVFFSKGYSFTFKQFLKLARRCRKHGYKIIRNTSDVSVRYIIQPI